MAGTSVEKHREWSRTHYLKHKEEYLARTQEKRRNTRDLIDALKTKCVICGFDDPRALEFHHRDPEDKAFEIGQAASLGIHDFEIIRREIQKCDVVCANCHRIIHAEMKEKM